MEGEKRELEEQWHICVYTRTPPHKGTEICDNGDSDADDSEFPVVVVFLMTTDRQLWK